MSVSGVTIDGFTIDGDDPLLAGIALESGDNANASYGVRATSAVNSLIVQNNIVPHVEIGVRGDGLATGNLITGNWFDSIGHFDFGYAVTLRNNFYADVTNNLMTRVCSGVHTNNFSLAGTGSWSVSGNEIHSYAAGLWHNFQYSNATNLTVANNQFLAEAGAVANDIGILIVTQQDAISTSLTGNTISGHDYGVVLYNTVSSNPITLGSTNTISNNGVGVYLTDIVGFNPVTNTILGGAANNPNGVSRAVLDGALLSGNTTGILVNGTNVNSPDGAQLTVQNGVSITGGTTGLSVVGPNAAIAGGTLTDTAFTGQSQFIVLSNGALDNQEINATAVTFDGTTGAC